MKQELILIKIGEIALKGLNRRTFEEVLMKNIKRHLAPLGKFEVKSAQSAIYVRPLEDDVDLDDARCSASRPIPGPAWRKRTWTTLTAPRRNI